MSSNPSASSSGAFGWLASALKKPFSSSSSSSSSSSTDAAKKKPKRNSFWRRSPQRIPGSARRVRSPQQVSSASSPAAAAAAPAAPAAPASPDAPARPASTPSPPSTRQSRSDSNPLYPTFGGVAPPSAASPTSPVFSSPSSSRSAARAMSPIPTVSPASGQLRHSRTHDSFQTPPAATPSPHPSTTSAPAAASSSSTPPPKSSPSSPSSYYGSKEHSAQKHRAKLNRFMTLLEDHTTDLAALRRQSWTGIPRQVRSVVWQLLLGYLPANRSRRQPTLARKRAEYVQYAEQYYDEVDESSRTSAELEILHQIRVDVPRTCPSLAMFQTPQVQHSLERVLYVWAVRHPASGYVQGINDICTPFFVLFFVAITGIGAATTLEDEDDAEWLEFTRLITPDLIERVSPDQFLMVEADCFWCLSKLIDGIQDNYTFAQPGIQKMVFKLQELVLRIDASLHQHLADENVQFMQFAFRWMNCLLHRELSLPLIVRAWDTYLAQPGGDGFKEFHVYMCAAFLMHFASELKAMEFQELVVFLQNLPTEQWTFKELETLIAQAYVYQSLFHNAPKHLEG